MSGRITTERRCQPNKRAPDLRIITNDLPERPSGMIVASAVESRIAALGGPATFDDDDLTETAGPGEEGESEPDPRVNDQADEKSPAEIAVEKVLAELNAATDAKAVAKIEKAQEPHIAFLPEHLAAILETALGHAKARVGAKEEA